MPTISIAKNHSPILASTPNCRVVFTKTQMVLDEITTEVPETDMYSFSKLNYSGTHVIIAKITFNEDFTDYFWEKMPLATAGAASPGADDLLYEKPGSSIPKQRVATDCADVYAFSLYKDYICYAELQREFKIRELLVSDRAMNTQGNTRVAVCNINGELNTEIMMLPNYCHVFFVTMREVEVESNATSSSTSASEYNTLTFYCKESKYFMLAMNGEPAPLFTRDCPDRLPYSPWDVSVANNGDIFCVICSVGGSSKFDPIDTYTFTIDIKDITSPQVVMSYGRPDIDLSGSDWNIPFQVYKT